MRRAHNLRCAGDVVFVDSTASCDAENHSIIFMLTVCSAGAVPLAVIINKGQIKHNYLAGFQMVKEAIGESSFNEKGFPTYFMTDHSFHLFKVIALLFSYRAIGMEMAA